MKQVSQDLADRWGGALTSTFLVLGLFSLATGALLIVLIFMTLAAERRGELGVARALGARRGDVIVAFLIEGASTICSDRCWDWRSASCSRWVSPPRLRPASSPMGSNSSRVSSRAAFS